LATFLGLLGSLSYFGGKVIWLPLMLLGAMIWGFGNRIKWTKIVMWMAISTGLMILYGWMLGRTTAGVRLGELKWTKTKTSEIVNEERRKQLELPPLITQMISNKAEVTIREIGQKYMNVFSLNYFLTDSEANYDNFSIPGHGYLYFFEIPLILLGWGALYKISMRGWILVNALILVVPLPGALNNYAVTYALRAGLLFPIIAGLGGIGWWELKNIIGNKWRWITYFGLMVPSLLFFQILYWYKVPFEKSAGYAFHERVLINYLIRLRETNNENIMLAVNDPIDVMYNYAFYTGKYNDKDFVKRFNQAISDGSYTIDKINFSRDCPTVMAKDSFYIWERTRDCVGEPNMLTRISEPRDGGARFFIPNDLLCLDKNQMSYPYPRKIVDFNLEKMELSEFCQKWINKP